MVHIGWTLFHEAHFWPHIAAKAGQASSLWNLPSTKPLVPWFIRRPRRRKKKKGKEGGPHHWIGYEMDTISQNCC